MSRALRAVYRHWFAPAPLRDLAFVRILVVSLQLLVFLPSLEDQLWLVTVDDSAFRPLPALKVLLLPFGEWGARPDPMLLQAVWIIAVVTGVMAAIGWFTRPSSLLFAATNTLMVAHGYSYRELHHPEAVLIIGLWVLAVSPAGDALSVDDLRRRWHTSTHFISFRPRLPAEEVSQFARWPLRTIQWVLVLAYLSAGLSKLVGAGLDWVNGYTLGYFLLQDGLRWDRPLGVWLHDKTALLAVVSGVVLLFELTFFVAILVPALTPIYLLIGTGMHIGTFVLQKAPFFQFIVLYSVFADPLRRAFAGARQRSPPTTTVIYDGSCGLCIRVMVLLDYVDLRRQLHFVDLQNGLALAGIETHAARHAMHVVGSDGTVHRGFFAFRRLARMLPALWPVLPFLFAPFAAKVGPAAYARVAARRCYGGSCGYPIERPREPASRAPMHSPP